MAQLGRALRSGRRGRRFKSFHPDHKAMCSFETAHGFFTSIYNVSILLFIILWRVVISMKKFVFCVLMFVLLLSVYSLIGKNLDNTSIEFGKEKQNNS